MAYGIIKVDQVTFTNGGIDQTISVSGIVQSISGNITATGTIQGQTIIGTSTVSGATVTGDAGVFTLITGQTAGFTTITGATVTGDVGRFTTLTGTSIIGTSTISGGNVAGVNGNFSSISSTNATISSKMAAGTVSGVTVTGNAGQFTTLTGGTAGFTTVTGTTVTGTTANFATLSGTTITGNHVTTTSGTYTGNVTAAAFVPTGSSVPANGVYLPSANNVAISTSSVGRLFIDASGKVGVGTAATASLITANGKLTLSGAEDNQLEWSLGGQIWRANMASGGNWYVYDPTNTKYPLVVEKNSTSNITIAASSIQFFAGGTEKARLTSDGRLALGTSSPGTLLHLKAGSNAETDLPLTIQNSADSLRLGIGAYGLSNTEGVSQGSDFYYNVGRDHLFQTDGSTKVAIKEDGKVGLGTSSPATLLHLSSATGSATPTPTELRIATTTNAGDWSTTNPWGRISYYSGDASSGGPKIHAAIDAISNGAAGTSSALDFKIASNLDATLNSVMRLTFEGNVGIGTTAPNNTLQIDSDSEFNILGLQRKTTPTATFSIGINSAQTVTNLNYQTSDLRVTRLGTEYARIDSSGRLLVGTSTSYAVAGASRRLQVHGANASDAALSITRWENANAAPRLVFGKSNGALGTFTAVADTDALGQIEFAGANGTDLSNIGASISAFVDGTPFSGGDTTDLPGRLVFSTTPDGASSPAERMRIDSSGDTIFSATSNKAGILTGAVNGKYISWANSIMYSGRTGTSLAAHINFYNANGNVGSITTDASATAYNTSSDHRLKENVVLLTGAADRLNQLQVHRFNFIADPDKTVDGFLAHEAQAVVPECVTGTKDEVDDDGNPVYQGIDQSKIVPLVVAALQEALAEIETLKTRLADAGIN